MVVSSYASTASRHRPCCTLLDGRGTTRWELSLTKQIESWLRTSWLPEGPSVCVLEGESGVGKTTIANQFLNGVAINCIQISASGGSLGMDDTLLELALALDGVGIDAMANNSDGDLIAGLTESLNCKVLVVIDDFDELVNAQTGLPPSIFLNFLKEISRRTSKGRLLLISGLGLAEGAWQEGIVFRTVSPLADREASDFLDSLLRARGRDNEVPEQQRVDVVRWLGKNPRALEALVACLQFYSLDELIELEQDAWGVRDQVVAPALIAQLEERFTSRTLSRLDPDALLLLQFLSVYRKPFTREAIDRLPEEIKTFETELQSRFLMSRARRWFSLSRFAREIARSEIEKSESRRQYEVAHSLAADNFVRHFAGASDVNLKKHGGEFVEARFHLARCGRAEEFFRIAGKVQSSLLLDSTATNRKIPENLADRDQLIACLGAALSVDDAPRVQARTFLARLLVDREGRDDKLRALHQVALATKAKSPSNTWMIRLKLAAEVDTVSAFRAAAEQTLAASPATSQASLFYQVAKLHALAGRTSEALDTLTKGFLIVKDGHGQADLHQLRSAILARQDRYQEAFEDLLDFAQDGAFENVPLNGQQRTFERAVFMAFGSRDARLQERLLVVLSARPKFQPQLTLCKLIMLQTADRYQDVDLVEKPDVPYAAETAQRAFSHICAHRARDALDLLIKERYAVEGAQAWLWAVAAYCNGRNDLATMAIAELSQSEILEQQVTPSLLITLWYNESDGIDKNPAYWHPKLPQALTGLPRDLVRRQGPVTPLQPAVIRGASLPVSPILNADLVAVTRPAISHSATRSDVAEEQDVGREIRFMPITINTHGDSMTDSGAKYNFSGPVGAAGDGASAHDFVQTFQQLNSGDLQADLARLREAMRGNSSTLEHDLAIAEVGQAEAAVASGDVVTAKGHLAKAGKWAWSTATAIGAGVAAAAIKAAIGF